MDTENQNAKTDGNADAIKAHYDRQIKEGLKKINEEIKASGSPPPPQGTHKLSKARERARVKAESLALREVIDKVNETAKLAIATLKGFLDKELKANVIQAKDAALLVVYCEPGRELRDDVCEDLMKLMKMPIVVFPKTMSLDTLSADALEAAGWVRKIRVAE